MKSLAGRLASVDFGAERVAGLGAHLDFERVRTFGEIVVVDWFTAP
jgi:hypothetical protein